MVISQKGDTMSGSGEETSVKIKDADINLDATSKKPGTERQASANHLWKPRRFFSRFLNPNFEKNFRENNLEIGEETAVKIKETDINLDATQSMASPEEQSNSDQSQRFFGRLLYQNPSGESNVRGKNCELCDKIYSILSKLFK